MHPHFQPPNQARNSIQTSKAYHTSIKQTSKFK